MMGARERKRSESFKTPMELSQVISYCLCLLDYFEAEYCLRSFVCTIMGLNPVCISPKFTVCSEKDMKKVKRRLKFLQFMSYTYR